MTHYVTRTLIVDDEPIARRILREELELFPEVEVAGEAGNGREALQKIAEVRPDLVFLDLQMPEMTGLEVVRHLTVPGLPVVVFVTAFDQHAIQAFEAGAIDYLLKPVDGARLHRAVDRARRLRNQLVGIAHTMAKTASFSEAPNGSGSQKILGRNGDDYHLLDPDEILAFCKEGEVVWIMTAKQKFLAGKSLQTLQNRLGEGQFRRVQRNVIVNVDHVRKMCPLTGQRWRITLSNSSQVIVSTHEAHTIRQILQW